MEWFVVLLVILLFFGARKLPEIARSLGRSRKEFKAGLEEGAQNEASVDRTEKTPAHGTGSAERRP